MPACAALLLISCTLPRPIPDRYAYLTSGGAATLGDIRTLYSAPPTFQVIAGDCPPGATTELIDEDINRQDNLLRSKNIDILDVSTYWTAKPYDGVDETKFTMVALSGGYKLKSEVQYSESPKDKLGVASALKAGNLQLVIAKVARRVDISENGRACFSKAAERACKAMDHKGNVYYIRSMLYGSSIRAASKKLEISSDAQFQYGQPFELRLKADFTSDDISGGYIGKMETVAARPDEIRALGTDKIDLPQLLVLLKENKVIRMGEILDKATLSYGVIAVDMETIECSSFRQR